MLQEQVSRTSLPSTYQILVVNMYFWQIILEEREQQKIREQQDLQAVYEEKISAIKEEHQLALQQRKMRVVSPSV